jgi:catechol 2,3-dioxygenase-like lactoylglutathione lyase family enzyme
MRALHHVALGARDVERVAAWYRDALGLAETARHLHADGSLRSIWLDMGGPLLMIERSETPGPFLLAFRCDVGERAALEAALGAVEARTAFTSYARDPEGGRVAVSHHPERA